MLDVARLNRIARRQRGLFTLDQALHAGWTRPTIRRWLADGFWEEVAPRVYRSPTFALSWIDTCMAEALSADAIAARRSAAALYGLMSPPRQPELLVARRRRNLDRVAIHSTQDLPASDLTRVGVVPATMPIRTVIDTANDLRLADVEDLVDRALLRRLAHPIALARRAHELMAPARPGAARVLAALSTRHPDLVHLRNEWEAKVVRLCERLGLPEPEVNVMVRVGGRRRYLDVAWQPAFVNLEFDGYEPHMSTRKAFEDDRVRQNDLVDAGWMVFRLTSAMLTRRHFEPVARAVSHRSSTRGIAV